MAFRFRFRLIKIENGRSKFSMRHKWKDTNNVPESHGMAAKCSGWALTHTPHMNRYSLRVWFRFLSWWQSNLCRQSIFKLFCPSSTRSRRYHTDFARMQMYAVFCLGADRTNSHMHCCPMDTMIVAAPKSIERKERTNERSRPSERKDQRKDETDSSPAEMTTWWRCSAVNLDAHDNEWLHILIFSTSLS